MCGKHTGFFLFLFFTLCVCDVEEELNVRPLFTQYGWTFFTMPNLSLSVEFEIHNPRVNQDRSDHQGVEPLRSRMCLHGNLQRHLVVRGGTTELSDKSQSISRKVYEQKWSASHSRTARSHSLRAEGHYLWARGHSLRARGHSLRARGHCWILESIYVRNV